MQHMSMEVQVNIDTLHKRNSNIFASYIAYPVWIIVSSRRGQKFDSSNIISGMYGIMTLSQ